MTTQFSSKMRVKGIKDSVEVWDGMRQEVREAVLVQSDAGTGRPQEITVKIVLSDNNRQTFSRIGEIVEACFPVEEPQEIPQ